MTNFNKISTFYLKISLLFTYDKLLKGPPQTCESPHSGQRLNIYILYISA